jgi:hypothetical protein
MVKKRIKAKDSDFCVSLLASAPWKNELWEADTLAAFKALTTELGYDGLF